MRKFNPNEILDLKEYNKKPDFYDIMDRIYVEIDVQEGKLLLRFVCLDKKDEILHDRVYSMDASLKVINSLIAQLEAAKKKL